MKRKRLIIKLLELADMIRLILMVAIILSSCSKKGYYKITHEHKLFLKEHKAFKDFKRWNKQLEYTQKR